eukprot:CAMPEP_0172309848 /NCGR_PEP_ID=MMETSP1058-20130122/10753_1 /TAXON_ID=83371 /ORGANISM="Detonula confervacea, Strain CCMP 353" /LENGTH=230 /DNA_ID=CAMNT_0013022549 /DNA_START=49 /DNA_END=741 /DNA_ORIENTATION=-
MKTLNATIILSAALALLASTSIEAQLSSVPRRTRSQGLAAVQNARGAKRARRAKQVVQAQPQRKLSKGSKIMGNTMMQQSPSKEGADIVRGDDEGDDEGEDYIISVATMSIPLDASVIGIEAELGLGLLDDMSMESTASPKEMIDSEAVEPPPAAPADASIEGPEDETASDDEIAPKDENVPIVAEEEPEEAEEPPARTTTNIDQMLKNSSAMKSTIFIASAVGALFMMW